MAGMGQSKGGGGGRDTIASPEGAASGAGHDYIKDPEGPSKGGGNNFVENPAGEGGTPPKQKEDGGFAHWANKESIPQGGVWPQPQGLDKAVADSGKGAPLGTLPPKQLPPIPTGTSAAPAIGAGHKPFRLTR